jgi:hypothetical protein
MKIAVFIFFIAGLSACGSNFVYNLIDTMVVSSIDRYFDLSREQKNFLKERMEYKLEQYRTIGIPEHIAFLKGIQDKVQKGLDQESVLWFIQTVNQQIDLAANHFSGDMVDLFMTLQDEQIDYYEKKLAEEDEKERTEREKLSEKKKKTDPDDVIESIENWLGPLDAYQKKEILQLVQQLEVKSEQMKNLEQEEKEKVEHRLKIINALRNERKNRPALISALNEIISFSKINPEDESTALFMEYILNLDRIITPDNRNHFNKKLNGWVENLKTLYETRKE